MAPARQRLSGRDRAAAMSAPPLLYYIRHGETDWNVEWPPAGPARHSDQRARARAGAAAAARSCATCWRATRSIRRSSISCRARSDARARRWNWRAPLPASRPAPTGRTRGSRKSRSALGRLHDRGIAPALARRGRAARARQMGLHAAGGGKLRHDVDPHSRLVRRARARHGRGRAWRHVARARRAARHRVGAKRRRSSISRRASSTSSSRAA